MPATTSLSDRHIEVLKYIHAHPGLNISVIQRGVRLPLTRRYVYQLQGMRLLCWKAADQRVKMWHLTSKAISFLAGNEQGRSPQSQDDSPNFLMCQLAEK